MGKQTIAQIQRSELKRVLTVRDVFALGFGDLGSSIYYALGITVLYALGAAPIALLIAGLVFSCTALTYAEMASVLKDSGGSASFSRQAFNDLISFIAGWGLLLDYIVTIAISSYAVIPYLSFFFPYLKLTSIKILSAVCIIVVLLVINIRGTKHSARLSTILTFATIITQFIMVFFGLYFFFDLSEFISHLKIGGADSVYSPTWGQFFHGVAMAMVAYTGIESMTQLGAEAKDPGKTIPRAIMYAMGLLLFMYLAISAVALSALKPHVLASQYLEDPLTGIAEQFPGGAVFAPWVGLLGAVILVVAANAGLIGASRLSFNMGEYFQLPRFFYKASKKYNTPYVALCVFSCLAIFIIIWSFGKLSFLADLYNFGAMLAFFSAHLSLIMHRIRYPDLERPFRIRCNIKIKGKQIPITAIIGAISTLSVWILVIITKAQGRYLGMAWLILGLSMYVLYRRKYKISPTTSINIEKVDVGEFKDIEVKKILVLVSGTPNTETIQVAVKSAKMFDSTLHFYYFNQRPYSMDIKGRFDHKNKEVERALNKASALALEYGLNSIVKIHTTRDFIKSLRHIIKTEEIDLLIVGAYTHKKIGPIAEEITSLDTRVWVISPKK